MTPPTISLEVLWKLFVNRSDRYLVESDDGWSWSQSRLTKKVINQHLEGKVRIGVAELDRESLTKFLLLDIDRHEEKNPEAVKKFDAVVERLRNKIDSGILSFKNAVRFVHTGNGVHLIIFFGQKAPAKILKESFMFPLLEKCEFRVEGDKWFDGDTQMGEIFPRQDTITKDGYAVRLPLGRHKNGEWSKVMFDQDLQSVIPIRLGKKLLNSFKSESRTRGRKHYDAVPEWTTPKDKIPLPGCIIPLINRESVHDGSHMNNLDLVQALLVSGFSVNEIHEIYAKMKGYKYSVTQYQTSQAIKAIREGRLPTRTYKCLTYKNKTHGLDCCGVAQCPRESDSTEVKDKIYWRSGAVNNSPLKAHVSDFLSKGGGILYCTTCSIYLL